MSLGGRSWSPLLRSTVLGLGGIYFVAAAVPLVLFGITTTVWFANAIAIAVMLKVERSAWPYLLAAVFVADTAAVACFASGPAPLIALADTGETFIVATLIRRLGGAQAVLSSVSGLARYILVCLIVPAFSATFGNLMLVLFEGSAFLPGALHWYAGTALGLLVVCPPLLMWSTAELRSSPSAIGNLHMALLVGGFAALTIIVSKVQVAAALFVAFPALLLVVWRGGLLGASFGSIVLLIVGIWQTFAGNGAIAALAMPATDLASQVAALQIYLASLTLSCFPLAVVLTDQRRLSAELARVAESRSEFLAAMSHEIRTPMTGVLGTIDLLEGEPLTPRQKSYLESIRASGRHLLNIINDILDFSRIETGRIELEHIDFSLPALLERLRSLLNPLAIERQITLAFELPAESPPVVRGDPTRLKQVLLNLAGNAIKFTPAGRVDIKVAYSGPAEGSYRFRFAVRDTGIGIPAAKQEELFSAFTQADRSTRRRFGGSGLGLAISKRLVAAMGGTIGVESREGQGSLFWFEVPLEAGDAMRLPGRPGGDAAAPVVPRRILLAEDLELNRDIIRTMLERDGHQVSVAGDGVEAVELARREAFDLILMDVHMPVLDGLEATRQIRSLPPPHGDLPILAVTANVMMTEQEKCLKAGANGVLMKPIDWDRMRAAIEDCCSIASPNTPDSAEDGPARFDRQVFDRLVNVLPPALLKAHLASLSTEVRQLASGEASGEDLAGRAHKLVSQAGMLGLMRLSSLAAEVEQAALAGQSPDQALAGFRAAAADLRLAAARLSDPLLEPARRTS